MTTLQVVGAVVFPFLLKYLETMHAHPDSMLSTSYTTCVTKASQLLCIKDPQITTLAMKNTWLLARNWGPQMLSNPKVNQKCLSEYLLYFELTIYLYPAPCGVSLHVLQAQSIYRINIHHLPFSFAQIHLFISSTCLH